MSSKPPIVPFAVRPRDAKSIAGCGITQIYERLNSGRYQSFLDGTSRLVVVQSILDDQQRLLAATGGTPSDRPSIRGGGPGRPKKTAPKKHPRRKVKHTKGAAASTAIA